MSETPTAPIIPKSALQLEREALWKQFETERIRSPDFTPTSSARRCSRIHQEKSITTTPITTFSTTSTYTSTSTYTPATTTTTKLESEKAAKKQKRKWWSCFGGGGVESDHEEVVNEKR
jgi:hypothetical protein